MKCFAKITTAVAMLLAVAGCTRNTVVFVVPSANLQLAAQQRAIRAIQLPCAINGPGLPHFESFGRPNPLMLPETPAFAKAQGVSGCASAIFQLDSSGAPINVRLMKEWPLGYGFGQSLLAALPGNRFHPAVLDGGAWYPIIAGMRSPPRPAGQ